MQNNQPKKKATPRFVAEIDPAKAEQAELFQQFHVLLKLKNTTMRDEIIRLVSQEVGQNQVLKAMYAANVVVNQNV